MEHEKTTYDQVFEHILKTISNPSNCPPGYVKIEELPHSLKMWVGGEPAYSQSTPPPSPGQDQEAIERMDKSFKREVFVNSIIMGGIQYALDITKYVQQQQALRE